MMRGVTGCPRIRCCCHCRCGWLTSVVSFLFFLQINNWDAYNEQPVVLRCLFKRMKENCPTLSSCGWSLLKLHKTELWYFAHTCDEWKLIWRKYMNLNASTVLCRRWRFVIHRWSVVYFILWVLFWYFYNINIKTTDAPTLIHKIHIGSFFRI